VAAVSARYVLLEGPVKQDQQARAGQARQPASDAGLMPVGSHVAVTGLGQGHHAKRREPTWHLAAIGRMRATASAELTQPRHI
jgi:hypothetical protein